MTRAVPNSSTTLAGYHSGALKQGEYFFLRIGGDQITTETPVNAQVTTLTHC